MLTSAFTIAMMCLAVTASDDKSADQCFQFIFDAVIDGLAHDGLPRSLAKKLAGNDHDFVEKCTICAATRKALYHYAHQTDPTESSAVSKEMLAKLESADNVIRRSAIRDLFSGYVQRAYAAKKMTSADQVAMQRAIATERDRAMKIKPADLEFCPSCEGGSCQVPPDEATPWGDPNENGIVSRLSLVTRHPQVGKKLQLRLEIKNTGAAPASFDDQQARVNGSLSIRGPHNVAIPYISLSFQTMGFKKQIAANDIQTIFADLDAASQYLMDQPGDYVIQFVGRGGIPPSNELKVHLEGGKLNDFQSVVLALRKDVPQGWRVATYMNSISILHTPTNLKRDATSVTVFFTPTKEHGHKPGKNQPPPKHLMETRLGHAWLQPQNEQTILVWGDYEVVIANALKAVKKN